MEKHRKTDGSGTVPGDSRTVPAVKMSPNVGKRTVPGRFQDGSGRFHMGKRIVLIV